ncbi:flagellar basal body-associated FliL family protein [Pleionea sediminis]|uniref:flagellar basal body-associated FliL family protein n=1 Tax=Pleionea sediminis TaxID=2569479 RepID=UPI001184BA9E|nr:flagellar basal body-associated FliL family protein [Pleionea sediminis]
MAEDEELALDGEEGKGGNKWLIIIIVGVAALGLGVGAAWFFLSGDDSGEATTVDAEAEPKKEPAIYVGVPGAIISPIKGDKRDRMVQIKISFLVRGIEAEDKVKKHMPRLTNDLLTLVSQANADVIIKPDGRQTLQDNALLKVQETMTEVEGQPFVEKVLFVSFVMQ